MAVNPHSTYANLSDEERAGLDARGRLLRLYDEPTLINAVAAEAVAAYQTGLAEAVRALGLKWESDADVIEMADTSTKARRALSAEVLRLCAAELLTLLEDKAEPSNSEIGGPDGHGNVILERLGKAESHVHDQRFDGDSPYLICACGARWDAITGTQMNVGRYGA